MQGESARVLRDEQPYDDIDAWQAGVLVASELAEDELVRMRAERLIRRAASTLLEQTIETHEQLATPVYATLMDALHAAHAGDSAARKTIETNVHTDMVERTIKAGHVMAPVELTTDASGKIWQFGQSMDDVYMNALRYTSEAGRLRGRTEAETRNGSRIEHHDRAGRLEDYYFVVISRCADDMDDAALAEAGFFTDTKSCAIQFTYRENGVLKTESAFVAGSREKDAPRHDGETIASLGERLGVQLDGLSASELIDTPLLIPKETMPEGVVNMVELYDDCAGGTFFGQNAERQDYAAYRLKCQEREDALQPSVQRVVRQLINEAPAILTPQHATGRLHKLSERELLDVAITDARIDPRVFGEAAAGHIEAARYYRLQGNTGLLEESRRNAQATARSASCPNAALDKETDKNNEVAGQESEENGGKRLMSCPFCGDHVFADPCASRLACGSCLAVASGGKIVSEGNGGHKRRVSEKARREAEATREYLRLLFRPATAEAAVKSA